MPDHRRTLRGHSKRDCEPRDPRCTIADSGAPPGQTGSHRRQVVVNGKRVKIPSVPVSSIKELIALARTKPGSINYSSGRTAGSTHLAVELFKSMAGVNLTHIAYKGGGAATTALYGGEVQLTLMGAGSVAAQVKAGKLKALAVTSAEPSAMAPGLPTVAASGVPGYEAIGLFGLLAPARTPAAIISRLGRDTVRVLSQPEVKERFHAVGMEVIAGSPEQFTATIKEETAKWGKVGREAGIKGQ